jgi:hypothetical protein
VFYRTLGGAEVVRDWLRSLDDADRQAVGLDLMRGAHVAAEQPDRSRPV